MIQFDRPLVGKAAGAGPQTPGLYLTSVRPGQMGDLQIWWAQARLIVPPKGSGADIEYLHAMTVTVLSEQEHVPLTARLFHHLPLQLQLFEFKDTGLYAAEVQFNLQRILGRDLFKERFFMRMGARELVSNVEVLDLTDQEDGTTAFESATEHLVGGISIAYASILNQDFEMAHMVFERMLQDAKLADNLDAAHRYHAACNACRMAGTSQENDDGLAGALDWLKAEAGGLADQWTALANAEKEATDPALKNLRQRQLAALRARIVWMRNEDPDLAPLRGLLKIDPLLAQAGLLKRLDG